MNSVKLDVLMISFINNMNKRGPKMDPCETPHVTGRISDVQLLMRHIVYGYLGNLRTTEERCL